ncbi:MAG TPA: lytic transglycosylase domain-containing protein, partial [Stellaceae bacterium]|nr:lytic transglycosylase domain-containing protein [Stellaceae bacterium]
MRRLGAGLAATMLFGGAALAADTTPATREAVPPSGRLALCRTVDRVAGADRLSAAFLTRILWQESGFRSDALSPKGAEGVAQFMPPTALDRGLADPWDPGPAIVAAGRLLADLAARFGNIGLAAAAYNAGAARVEKWLQAESGLPAETRNYVRAVTGRQIEDWKTREAAAPWPATGGPDCMQTIALLPRGGVLAV